MVDDPFDPTLWPIDNHEYRIYGNAALSVWAIVDAIDYPFLTHWCWTTKTTPGGKVYLRRSKSVEYLGGGQYRNATLYLHIEIMKRVASPPEVNSIVDHLDGDSLNCRRSNLRWCSQRDNTRNRHGSYLKQKRIL